MLLDEKGRAAALRELPGWTYDVERAGLTRTFRFRDFAEAFAFMTRVAEAAERMDHHPDWSQSWNRVDIFLTTFIAGGVTAKDVALAKVIDTCAPQLASPPAPH